jgi:hypothetical protein
MEVLDITLTDLLNKYKLLRNYKKPGAMANIAVQTMNLWHMEVQEQLIQSC